MEYLRRRVTTIEQAGLDKDKKWNNERLAVGPRAVGSARKKQAIVAIDPFTTYSV